MNNMYNRKNTNNIRDYGPEPIVINIENITKENNTFRTTLWTGNNMQLTSAYTHKYNIIYIHIYVYVYIYTYLPLYVVRTQVLLS